MEWIRKNYLALAALAIIVAAVIVPAAWDFLADAGLAPRGFDVHYRQVALRGGTLLVQAQRFDLDTDTDSSIRASADDTVILELGGADIWTWNDPAAAAASGDLLDTTATLTIMDGSDVQIGWDVNITGADHTGTGNTITGIDLGFATGDAQSASTAFVIGSTWDLGIDTDAPIFSSAVQWYDDFLGDLVLGQYTEISGADAQAVQAIVEEQFGVYQLTSGDVGDTPANDLEAITLSLEWQGDQGSLIFETRIHIDTAVTTAAVCAGLSDDVATVEMPAVISVATITTNATDGVFFCYDTDATTDEWYFISVDSDTDGTGTAITGTAPVADTYQVLRIEVDTAGAVCRGYIDGTLSITITAGCLTSTVALAPWVGIDSHTAASRILDIDYIYTAAQRN